MRRQESGGFLHAEFDPGLLFKMGGKNHAHHGAEEFVELEHVLRYCALDFLGSERGETVGASPPHVQQCSCLGRDNDGSDGVHDVDTRI